MGGSYRQSGRKHVWDLESERIQDLGNQEVLWPKKRRIHVSGTIRNMVTQTHHCWKIQIAQVPPLFVISSYWKVTPGLTFWTLLLELEIANHVAEATCLRGGLS